MEGKFIIIARPDHSIELLKSNEQAILYTWGVFAATSPIGSVIKRIFPSARLIHSNRIKTSLFLTLVQFLNSKIKNEWVRRKAEIIIFNGYYFFLLLCAKKATLHLWPLYTEKAIRYANKLRLNKFESIIMEIYQAYPKFLIENNLYKIGEDWSFSKYNLEIERFNFNKEKYILKFPSEFVANTFIKYFPNIKYIIEPYPFDKYVFGERKTYRKLKDKLLICYAGQVSYSKGYDILVTLKNEFKNEIELVVFGTCQDSKIEKGLLDSGVVYMGKVRKEVLQKRMTIYDVYIHPSSSDAWSISCAEALGCGLPVITSRNNGFSDLLSKNNVGIVVDENRYDDYRRVIHRLLRDKENMEIEWKKVEDFLNEILLN